MIGFPREKMEAPLTALLKAEKMGRASDLPTVFLNDPVEKIVKVILRYRRKKAVYVINEDNTLIGLITVRGLMRTLFSLYHKPEAHSRRIIQMLTADSASEIMNKEIYFQYLDVPVEEVLHYMIKRGVYAIPIVSKEKKLLHEISLRDILRFLNSPD